MSNIAGSLIVIVSSCVCLLIGIVFSIVIYIKGRARNISFYDSHEFTNSTLKEEVMSAMKD